MAVQRLEVPASQTAASKQSAELDLVEQLKKAHGVSRVHVLSVDSGETVYVRMPKVGEWRRFRSHMQNPAKRDEAGEQLFKACLLHPDKAAFDLMCDEKPGLLDTFASEVAEIAGLSKDVEKKVL